MESEEIQAAAALKAIAEAKKVTANSSAAPLGYYSALGLAMGILTTTLTTEGTVRTVLFLVAVVIAFGSILWYSRSVPTWRFGRLLETSAWAFWVMVAIGGSGMLITGATGRTSVGVGLGTLTFISWSILGPLWDRAYRQQLESK